MRLRTILDPRVSREIGTMYGKREACASDYIAVPVILTFGTWSVLELLGKAQRAALARFTNTLSR